MVSALTDRLVNVLFAVCCVAVVGIGVTRYRTAAATGHVGAREHPESGRAGPVRSSCVR